jgi:hypothetical protein
MPTSIRPRSPAPTFTLILFALAASAPAIGAQIRIAAAIAGTVTDSSDAVVPGAAVHLVDDRTGIARDTVTNDSGGFSSLICRSDRIE